MAIAPLINPSSHEFARGYTYLEDATSYTITSAERFLHFMLDTPPKAFAEDLLIEIVQRVVTGRGDEQDVLAIELLQKRLVTERTEK